MFRAGDGSPLHGRLYAARPCRAGFVVVHGWDPLGQRHGFYLAFAETMRARGYSVLTFNLPGYPGSEARPSVNDLTLQTLVCAVRAAIDALRATNLVESDRIVLFGHSYGAGLVVPTLAQQSDVWKAAIYSPSTWVERRVTAPGAPQRDFFHERFWRYMGLESPVPLETFLHLLKSLYIPNQVHMLGNGHPPLLLLDGGDESPTIRAFSRHLYKVLPPPSTYYSIPGADHFCNTAALGRFLVSDRDVLDSLADFLDVWLWRE